eukprot:1144851-Pelagomonas_calceolata.AAC.6
MPASSCTWNACTQKSCHAQEPCTQRSCHSHRDVQPGSVRLGGLRGMHSSSNTSRASGTGTYQA